MSTGGVIIAVSISITTTTPNHTGSNPALNMMGAMIGTVIDSVSITMPSTT